MPNCLFCKIIHKEIPANVLSETDELIAFSDIAPKAPHHILIIPKIHIATVNDILPEQASLVGKMILLAQQIAKDLKVAEPGYRLVFNCNEAGGQAVYHLHLHLLAGRELTWPPG